MTIFNVLCAAEAQQQTEVQMGACRRVLHSPEMQAMLRCSCGSGLLGGNCCLTTSMQDSLMYRKFHFCECSYAVRAGTLDHWKAAWQHIQRDEMG